MDLDALVAKFDLLKGSDDKIDRFHVDEICTELSIKPPESGAGSFTFHEFIHAVVDDESLPVVHINSLNRLKQYFDQYVKSGSGVLTSRDVQRVYSASMGRTVEIAADSAKDFDESGIRGVGFTGYVMLVAMIDAMNIAPQTTTSPLVERRGSNPALSTPPTSPPAAQIKSRAPSFGSRTPSRTSRQGSFGSAASASKPASTKTMTTTTTVSRTPSGKTVTTKTTTTRASTTSTSTPQRASSASQRSSTTSNYAETATNELVDALEEMGIGLEKGATEFTNVPAAGNTKSLALPATFTNVLEDQSKPGFLNTLKAKYDMKVTKRTPGQLGKGNAPKMTAQDLFDVCRSFGVPITTDQAKKTAVNGFVSFEDFLYTVVIDKNNPILQHKDLNALKRFFDEYDLDHNGTIKVSEMAEVYFKKTGRKMSSVFIKQQLALGDTNKDGLVDFEEYVKMMSQEADQMEQVTKLNNTEERMRAANSHCGKLHHFVSDMFRQPPIQDYMSQPCKVMLADVEEILSKATQAEVGGDHPGVLVHLLTAFTLTLKITEEEMPDDSRTLIRQCAKNIKLLADQFRTKFMRP